MCLQAIREDKIQITEIWRDCKHLCQYQTEWKIVVLSGFGHVNLMNENMSHKIITVASKDDRLRRPIPSWKYYTSQTMYVKGLLEGVGMTETYRLEGRPTFRRKFTKKQKKI